MEERESMTNQISRDEVRSAIEDKLCAHFGTVSYTHLTLPTKA